MTQEVMVALIGLAGSAMGSALGVLASARLTSYRLEQLEKKVDKHNQVVERTFRLEARADVLEEDVKAAVHRLSLMERGVMT